MTKERNGNGIFWQRLALGGGAGIGMALTYVAWELVKAEPKLVLQLVGGWGPLGVIAIISVFVIDRRFGQSIEATRESAKAQQELAGAVQRIAEKDDEKFQELELAIGTTARNTRAILDRLGDLEKAIHTQRSAAKGVGG